MCDLACPICGGTILGDGWTTPMHCENVFDLDGRECDGPVIFCKDPRPKYTVARAPKDDHERLYAALNSTDEDLFEGEEDHRLYVTGRNKEGDRILLGSVSISYLHLKGVDFQRAIDRIRFEPHAKCGGRDYFFNDKKKVADFIAERL